MPSTDFEKAVIEVEMIKGEPADNEKLRLYGLFKIAKGEEVKQAGLLDFVGKAKYNEWDKLRKEYTSPAEGEAAYIKTVEELKEKYGFDATRTTKLDGKAIDAAKLKRYEELTK